MSRKPYTLIRIPTPLVLLIRYAWALPLLAVLAWANWETPQMHHFVRPAATAIWQLAPLDSPAQAEALRLRLAAEPGVAACAVSLRTGCVALVYHPDEVAPAALYQAVVRFGAHVVSEPPANVGAPVLRECPVPPGYFLLIDRVRFALNLRRFFVTV
ncbi:hypothetical protein [uncultured Hymenobacter sp.]|uniref:hypothetical protein n=1 Tax=uncultured Hymenobacter sp. TaxID=170016 RepID=UPI0035CABE9D